MKFYSTKNKNLRFSFREAVLMGIAPDGGLFMPTKLPKLKKHFLANLNDYSFKQIAFEVSKFFIDDIVDKDLKKIINSSFTFPAPLRKLKKNLYMLELFHGPTLAFKDFGARFLANVFNHYQKKEKKNILILVATSGDTGGAVANAFYNKKGIRVVLLYPRFGVSKFQELQFSTLGKNIFPIQIDGTFDDCQRLVKKSFHDKELSKKFFMSSANSINIARLIPQMFYYFEMYKQIKDKNSSIVVSVPSGNLGNLCAGLFAKKMGLPIKKFIAALNLNKVFFDFLKNERFVPRKSKKTISNAMDVGNPSNFARIISLYKNNFDAIKKDVSSYGFDDKKTVDAIKGFQNDFDFVLDPHGAVGYLALKYFLEKNKSYNGVFFETAHPIKFANILQKIVSSKIKTPKQLSGSLKKKKMFYKSSANFLEFKKNLINNILNIKVQNEK